MVFRRYAAAAGVAVALTAAACGGARPPVTQPQIVISSPAAPPASPAPARAAQQPIPTAVLSGVVRSAEPGGGPIARARVIVVSEALTDPRVAITDAGGRYTIQKLPAGQYIVQASASGFAPQYHRQRPNSPPPPVPVTTGQRVTGVDVELPLAGVIVGRILDEDKKPFVGASVDALVSRMENGQPTLVSLATATTDDRGDFRLVGLPEGQYYVSAFDPAFAEVGDETGPLRYTATYYPGVVFVEQAERVTVRAGVEPESQILFALKIVRPALVSGLIATPDKRQLISGAVIMAPIHGEGLAAVPSDDVRINPDGRFTFRNVAPGGYQIRARAETDPLGVALFATFRIVVNGIDIDNVDMVLQPGAHVDGTLSFDPVNAPKPLSYAGLRVRAPFADGTSFGDALTGDVLADGRYSIRGLMSGEHYFTVEGLPPPWVLKHVLWKGQDITDIAVDVVQRQVIEDVRVTVTDLANDVSGVVRDGRGRPVQQALVLIIPLAPQFWTPTSRRFAMLRTCEIRTSVTAPSSRQDTAEICPQRMKPVSDQMPS